MRRFAFLTAGLLIVDLLPDEDMIWRGANRSRSWPLSAVRGRHCGRPLHSERREFEPDVPVEPFRRNGLLAGGESAASGVYGYIIRVGRERRYGKLVVFK